MPTPEAELVIDQDPNEHFISPVLHQELRDALLASAEAQSRNVNDVVRTFVNLRTIIETAVDDTKVEVSNRGVQVIPINSIFVGKEEVPLRILQGRKVIHGTKKEDGIRTTIRLPKDAYEGMQRRIKAHGDMTDVSYVVGAIRFGLAFRAALERQQGNFPIYTPIQIGQQTHALIIP